MLQNTHTQTFSQTQIQIHRLRRRRKSDLKIDFDKSTTQIALMTSKQHQQQETNRKKSIANGNHLGIFNQAILNLLLYELFFRKIFISIEHRYCNRRSGGEG